MRRTSHAIVLLDWARAFFADCGLDADVLESEMFEPGGDLTVRVHDRETDIVWRFKVMRNACVRDSRSAEAHVIAFFEDQELRIRQATFYVHHCREILRAIQQERHEAYMRALLEMKPEAQA
jgi:hypothetical protein